MAAGLRCGSTTIKYLLFFFNFLFVLCGLVLLIVGGLAAKTAGEANLGGPIIFILIVGALIFVVSFFGCCGAVRESNCMLATFACLLLTIIVLEVAAAIWVFVVFKPSSIDGFTVDLFNKAKGGDDVATATTDFFQTSLQCCGLSGPTFWNTVPDSCCPEGKAPCTNAFAKDCKTEISSLLGKFGTALGVIAIAVAVVEVIGVWFSLALAGEIKNLSR